MPEIFASYMNSPIGKIKLTSDYKSVTSVLFIFEDTEMPPENSCAVLEECKNQLREYFAGSRKVFDIPINRKGTDFQKRVWNELVKIPYGETVSYLQLAERLGDKNLIRAVGSANGKNPISIIVPCHRVIGADGGLTGYAGGLWRKEWLLKREKTHSGKERQIELFE